MVNASIKYLGWIEKWTYENPEYKTLTWSSTIVKFKSDLKNVSILIDYWMFQWWRNDDESNKLVDSEALNVDFMILTHAHLDHSWRLPLLVKNGFNKPIYMTKITALQAREMLMDYVSIMREKIELLQSKNSKIESKLKTSLYIIDSYNKLKSNKLSKEDRVKIKSSLFKKFWEKSIEDLYKESLAITEEYQVFSLSDIETHLHIIPELLFDEKDVEDTFCLVKNLEVWNEEILNDFFYIDNYSKTTLDDILSRVSNWNNEDIYIDTSIFNKVKTDLNEKIDFTSRALESNIKVDEENKELSEKLESYLDFINSISRELSVELYDEYLSFLTANWVSNYDDIQSVLQEKYHIEYDLNFLHKVKKLIKIRVKNSEERNKKVIDSIKLRFLDAWHIEWSVQALITVVTEDIKRTILKNSQVKWIRLKTNKHTNLLFSWDLWRIKDPNLSWVPEYSDLKLDYIQMESTYAWRNHPNRLDSEKELFYSIEKSHWKIIIPTFSMQRTQEVLVLLLENMLERKWDKNELEDLKLELKETQEKYDSIENKNSFKAKELEKAIALIKKDIKEVKQSSFFNNIVLDSALSRKITSIYLSHLNWKYNILDPEVQIKLFGRQVIEIVSSKEQQDELYNWKRKNRKEIIVTSSWMCEWWAVLSHLEQNLWNKKSTIIFVWYAPQNSRAWKIKSKNPVSIEWVVYDVECRVIDIKWFSWHCDEEEILTYLSNSKISRWATIALTHWTESRINLWLKIQKEVLKNRRSIDIIIPELWDEEIIKI